jgi:hypothetical protein
MTRIYLMLGLIIAFLAPHPSAKAYPQFIGYKYSSCLTCHYNGNGNGPLNDYGRAIWSAEIAGKLFNGKTSDEKLAETSGFLGSAPLPWWLRPGIKARQLYYKSAMNTDFERSDSITMQAEANVAVFFDRDQKYAFVGSIGYVPEPLRASANTEFDTMITREHYFRWQTSEALWLYIGKLDKVYGIRHVNHTAYSRASVGLAQNDQTHGVVAHYVKPDWEWSVHGFLGNMSQDADRRQVGASTLFEYEVKTAWRLGVSALNSANDYVGNQRFGVHSRYGFGYGASILFELGNIKNTPERGASTNGYYLYSEAMQKMARGYHVFVSGQAYKEDMVATEADNFKLAVGMLMFPMARTEFRFDLENVRSVTSGAVVPNDSWNLMLQAHISL